MARNSNRIRVDCEFCPEYFRGRTLQDARIKRFEHTRLTHLKKHMTVPDLVAELDKDDEKEAGASENT